MSSNRSSSLSQQRGIATLGAIALTIGVTLAARRLVAAARDATSPATPVDEFDPAVAQPEALGGAVLKPALGMIEAQKKALVARPGASVLSVELELEDDELVWEVELDDGAEIEIDAMTGKILKVEEDDEDDDNGGGDEDEDDN